MKNSIVFIDRLSFSYEDKENVLNDVSFAVTERECVGIIGPNGAGKTSLFLLICGILKPVAGSIRIKEREVVYREFNPSIGYIFQNPDDQLFSPTVVDDVTFGPLNMELSKSEIEHRVGQALEICNCNHLKDRPSHHLSVGEKRMVAIASVLAMEPEIMIYDEPTASLDMRARRDVINFIKNNEKTNLIASHDMEFISETCERVIILDSGKVVTQGDSTAILGNKDLMEPCGLEVPFSLAGNVLK